MGVLLLGAARHGAVSGALALAIGMASLASLACSDDAGGAGQTGTARGGRIVNAAEVATLDDFLQT